jgi:ligand-binding sensor domain-containing protein/signal transduction histidine kinase
MKTMFLTLFLGLTVYLNAQQIQYGWRNYTTNDGLPSPEVYTVIQDKKGFLWFGTDNGVSRFDGYTFQNFGAKEGLADNVINGIQEDEQGRIWFSSMWGKLYYFEKDGTSRYQRDSVYSFPHNALIESYQKSFLLVNGFLRFEKTENTEGGVLLGLSGLGLLKITDSGLSELITADETPALLAFSTGNKNIVVKQKLKGKYLPFPVNREWPLFIYDGQKLIKKGVIEQMTLTDNLDNTRFKIIGNTIYFFSTSRIHRINEKGQSSIVPYNYTIRDILTDEDGQVWTAEGANGGVKAYANADAIGTIPAQIVLEGVSPVTLLRDRNGGYWVTTIEKGVFYLRDKRIQIFNPQNAQFPFEVLNSVEYIEKSKVFIGFRQGVVGVFDKATSSYQNIVQLEKNNIEDVKWDTQHQKLLIGGIAGLGIFQDGQLNMVKDATTKKIALRPRQDAAWIVRSNSSLLYEIIGSTSYRRFEYKTATVKRRIFSIFEDRKNRLWVGKQDGLYYPEKDSLVAVPFIHTALTTRVEDMAELPNGSMVFATKGNGLVIYDGKNALNITKSDGLLTDMLENVATDAKGNIWVGTLAGLHKLSLQANGQWHIQPITMFHGLPTNEINDIAPSTEGVFLATPKGLVVYNDKPTKTATNTPFLTYFKAGNNNKNLEQSSVFSARENDIEIAWNCINFQMFGKIPYRYRMNTTAEWRYTENRNIQIASLAEGNYSFEVQAQNEDGVWGEALKLSFTILPYWYTTWWFRSLLLVSLLSGGFLFYKNRIKNLQQEHAIALQINDLERTALAAQMNPHFIFNCLNSIQLLIQSGEKVNAMTYLGHFAKLVRSTLESTRQGKITVATEAEALNHYLSLEKLRFKEGLTYKIDIDTQIDTFDTELPAMLIQPFVENALKHGLSMEQNSAHVSIHFQLLDPSFLGVEIKDNGKGFDENAQEDTQTDLSRYKLDGEVKTGVGIALSRKRLALLNGREDKNDLTIETIVNDKMESIGTAVKLVIMIL